MPKFKFDKNFLIFSLCIFFITLIICGYYFKRIYQPWGTSWTDFTVMERAGERILKGEAIYNPQDTVNFGIDIYKYSPAFAFFCALFAKMHMHKAVPIWYLLSFLSFLAAIFFIKEIILSFNHDKKLPKYFYFISFFLVLRFFLVLLSRVQSDSLVLFFIALSAWMLFLKKEAAAGFSLASAVMVKLTPLIFIPYLIYRKFYKAAFAAILGILAYLLLPALGLGWDKNLTYIYDWIKALSASTPDLMLWYKNQSLLSAVLRFFSEGSAIKIIALPPLAIKSIFGLTSLSIVFSIFYFSKEPIKLEKNNFGYAHLIEFSLILVCMVLFSPLGWKHTFLHLIVAYMALVYYLMKNRRDFLTLSLLVLSFIFNSVLNPEILHSFDEVVSLYSNVTWGAVILIIALLRVMYKLNSRCRIKS